MKRKRDAILTITTVEPHGFSVGQTVEVNGVQHVVAAATTTTLDVRRRWWWSRLLDWVRRHEFARFVTVMLYGLVCDAWLWRHGSHLFAPLLAALTLVCFCLWCVSYVKLRRLRALRRRWHEQDQEFERIAARTAGSARRYGGGDA